MSWDIDYGGLASSLFFTDAENGYLCTLSGKVYQRKGKENWEEQYSVDFCLSYLTVKNNVVISVGDSGIIRKEIPNIKYDTIVFIDTVRVYDTIRIEDLIKIFDTVEVEVEKIIEALSVIDFNSLDIDNNDPEMLVYPNPVGDYFYLDCIGYKNVFVELYDLKGMLLYKGKVDKKKFKISMEGMSPGMYILNIVFKGNSMKPVKIKKI